MQITTNKQLKVLLASVLAVALGGATAAQAAPKAAARPNGWHAMQMVEKVGGKKLTASQKASITKAANARDKSIGAAHKAAWDKFWATVSSTSKVPLAKLQAPAKKKS